MMGRRADDSLDRIPQADGLGTSQHFGRLRLIAGVAPTMV